MSKPVALDEAGIAEIEQRLSKGWVIRRDQIATLIAMARERNELVKAQPATSVAAAYDPVSRSWAMAPIGSQGPFQNTGGIP